MDARRLVKVGVTAGCAVLLSLTAACGGGSGSAKAGKSVTLRFSCACSDRDPQGMAIKQMADEVNTKTGGAVTIKPYLNSSLYDQNAEETALFSGTLDMADTAPAFLTDRYPAVSILTVPYLIKSPEQMQQVSSGPIGQKLFQGIENAAGIHVLTSWYLGTRTLDMRDVGHKIMTPQGMNGVKLRVPNAQSWIDLGKSLGAQPTPTAFGELYTALQTGTVDGQDNPLVTDKVQKFNEVTKQIVLTNHLVDIVLPAVNKKTWDKLTPDQQKIMSDAADTAAAADLKNIKGQEQDILTEFKKDGLAVYTPDVAAFRKYALDYYQNKTSYPSKWEPGMFDQLKQMPA